MEKSCLKKADYAHMDLLYKWANDKETRNNSLNTENISYEEHKKWFNKKMSSDQCIIYIYYYDHEPIGQIRLDFNGEYAYISYSIDKDYRGQGHGKKILALVEKELFQANSNIKCLCAIVKYSNIASQKLFEKLMFEKKSKEEYIEYYKNVSDTKL